ncbi:MAG: putative sulfate exporter family transporter [Bacteroidales bacterium]
MLLIMKFAFIIGKGIFFALLILSLFISPALALFSGIIYALAVGNFYVKATKKVSKYLLQVAVVGLGFGMNLHNSLAAGKEGIEFTVISVIGVMVTGCIIGRLMGLIPRLSYLISAGTAICGGSAIAAVSPVIKADDNETSMSLAVIFTLNAIALFIFPPIGEILGLTQHQFGIWAAIAIHDTSSVVGAASIYGEEALQVATTVKLTRALWIIPLSIVSIFIFRKMNRANSESTKISVPWFIFLFILAMIINTYVNIPAWVLSAIKVASHKALSVTLFLIGCGLSLTAIKQVGVKPVLLGVILWVIIALVTLAVVI